MTPRPVDYCAAACADAKVENLTIAEMQIAWESVRYRRAVLLCAARRDCIE